MLENLYQKIFSEKILDFRNQIGMISREAIGETSPKIKQLNMVWIPPLCSLLDSCELGAPVLSRCPCWNRAVVTETNMPLSG